jgi:hypothetical protein
MDSDGDLFCPLFKPVSASLAPAFINFLASGPCRRNPLYSNLEPDVDISSLELHWNFLGFLGDSFGAGAVFKAGL